MSIKFKGVVLCGAVIAVLSVAAWGYFSSEKEGFVGNYYVKFPSGKYTFLVRAETEGGRRVIKDNLWGFSYPDFNPLRRSDRKEFVTISPKWIRVTVEERQSTELCFGDVVKLYMDPEQKPLALYLYKGSDNEGFDARDVMKESPSQVYGLRSMSAPDKAHFKNVHIYNGPQIIFWEENAESKACTYIQCFSVAPDSDQQYCTHKYVDKKTKLYYSMNYNRENLAGWVSIQSQAEKIFKEFEVK
jgi:hypothetical protein